MELWMYFVAEYPAEEAQVDWLVEEVCTESKLPESSA
jgi:hypothetical protein